MSDGAILIRPEAVADADPINDLTERAFRGKRYSDGNEQALIVALSAAGALEISLVAEQNRQIVRHVALSPAIASDGSEGWYALGPILVEPTRQRQGIGGKLIVESMARLVARNAAGCVLIGDTQYSSRHGSTSRPDLAPADEPADHFMVRVLSGQAAHAAVAFHHPFAQFGGSK